MSRPLYGNKTHTILGVYYGYFHSCTLYRIAVWGGAKKYLRLKNHVEDNMALMQQVLKIKKNNLHKIMVKYYTIQNTKLK